MSLNCHPLQLLKGLRRADHRDAKLLLPLNHRQNSLPLAGVSTTSYGFPSDSHVYCRGLAGDWSDPVLLQEEVTGRANPRTSPEILTLAAQLA